MNLEKLNVVKVDLVLQINDIMDYTVGELIDKLSQYPKDMPVLIYDSEYEEYIEIKEIRVDNNDTVEDELIIVSE